MRPIKSQDNSKYIIILISNATTGGAWTRLIEFESYLLEKLQSVEQTYHELTRRLADPDIATNPAELQRVAKARSSLEETVNTYEAWKTTEEELDGARQIFKESAEVSQIKMFAERSLLLVRFIF